jgi:hypothetical protein
VRRYVIAPERDPLLAAELVELLIRNGVEVHRLTEPARLSGVRDREGRGVGSRTFPAGSYLVEAAQPRNRLIRVLMEPESPVPADFLREARERVERAENPRFYDITAWSLPLLFDVASYGVADGRRIAVEPVAGEALPRRAWPAAPARYAYLIDGRQAAAMTALWHLLDGGHRAALATKPTRVAGADVPAGTVVVRVGQNGPEIHDVVRDLAERHRLEVRAVDTGMGDAGHPALGSGDVVHVRKPEIAILAEEPVQAYSFGWAWYTLDQQYHHPVTVLRAGRLAATPLDRFDVLVLPELNGPALARLMGDEGQERLKRWVRDGGTLVTLGAATDFARSQLELIALRSWYDTDAGKEAQRIGTPGAILRGRVDAESRLAAGVSDGLPILVNSDRIYLAPEGPPSPSRRVVARFAPAAELRMAGHVWPETLERLPEAVFVYEERVGRGRVIAFGRIRISGGTGGGWIGCS